MSQELLGRKTLSYNVRRRFTLQRFVFERTRAFPLHHVNFKCNAPPTERRYSLQFEIPTDVSRSSYSPQKRSIAPFSLSFTISIVFSKLPQRRTSNTFGYFVIHVHQEERREKKEVNPTQNFVGRFGVRSRNWLPWTT